jgi:N-acetylglucosamine kinase-like BadF-type ATPase
MRSTAFPTDGSTRRRSDVSRRTSLLAVDGGNSKTDLALVTDRGELLALERGPTISHQQVPIEVATDRLVALARRAAAAGGDVPLPASRGSFVLAGADFASDIRLLTRAFGTTGVAERITVRNDAFGALRAGARSGWGIVVICGSGVNAAGIGPDGRTERFTAIDDLSGDFGGGYGIGVEALRLAVRARDGRGARTLLETVVPEHFGRRRPIDVTRAVYEGRIARRRLEELAPAVFAAAGGGDRVARDLLDRVADELALMAVTIARRLRVVRREVEVVLVGGVFGTADPAFHARVAEGIRRAVPGASVARLDAPPVLGAALLALDELTGRAPVTAERRLREAFAGR